MNTSTKSLPVVAGIEINIDEHGRYNLNALHRASGGDVNKAPNRWVRNNSTIALIRELENNVPDLEHGKKAISTVYDGINNGTYAHELLAVSYAGWISPSFQLAVNQAFLDTRTGKSLPQLSRLEILEMAIASEKEVLRLQQINSTQHALISECKTVLAKTVEATTYYDHMTAKNETVPLRVFAKLIDLKPNNFYKRLRDDDLKVLQHGCTVPYQSVIDSGYLLYKIGSSGYGAPHITAKGMQWLYKRLVQVGLVQDVYAQKLQGLIDNIDQYTQDAQE